MPRGAIPLEGERAGVGTAGGDAEARGRARHAAWGDKRGVRRDRDALPPPGSAIPPRGEGQPLNKTVTVITDGLAEPVRGARHLAQPRVRRGRRRREALDRPRGTVPPLG